MLVKSRLTTQSRRAIRLVGFATALGITLLTALTPSFGQQMAPGGGAVLRAYPCPGERAESMAEHLRREFASTPNVGIASDARVGQILVNAPEAFQAQIAGRLAIALQAPAARPNVAFPPNPNTQPAGVRPTTLAVRNVSPASKALTIQLRHASSQQIEASLAGAFGNRFTPVPSAGGAIRNYRVALSGGAWIDLGIHHQGGTVTLQGPTVAVDSCARLLQRMDSPPNAAGNDMRLVSVQSANPAALNRAVNAIRVNTVSDARENPMVAMLFQQPPAPTDPSVTNPSVNGANLPANGTPSNGQPTGAAPGPEIEEPMGGLVGPVQIEQLEGLDILVLTGRASDVRQVLKAIETIERISQETVPEVVVLPLRHVDCEAMAAIVTPLYEQIYLPRQGVVSITALDRPNSILLIGRKENVQTAKDLIVRLDKPVSPQDAFRVFRLRHASAATVQQTLSEYFGRSTGGGAQQNQATRGGLVGTAILVQVDYRSNSVIVRAGPGDMAEAARLIEQLDSPEIHKENELRVFYLENTMAQDLQEILQDAIMDQGGGGGGPGGGQSGAEQSSMKLVLKVLDSQGKRTLTSGVLIDVRVTADVRANSLVVSAPADSMELIEALIQQLDRLPAAQAQIKVFTIENGDATSLVEMLQTVFSEEGGTNEPATRTGAGEGESSLVRLRFGVDTRTNSILASGGMGDLKVVEAILLRLDDSDIRQRISKVYRLKNAPANDVATAINNFLSSERQVQQIEPGLVSPFEQIEREVVVVPEPVSNTLILSATKRFFEEIESLIEDLDKRPPMVMIQVVIAQIELNDTDEFGVELGLQSSLLFDRSVLGELLTTSVSSSTPGTGVVVTEDIIQSATNTPGFLFNNVQLGNSGSSQALNGSRQVAPQILSNFGLGRVNNQMSFGGLVMSASSESVSILIRALQERRNTTVLSRPMIMTLDNQPAYVHVGEKVPVIRSVTISDVGQTNAVDMQDVGLILAVTPRINPDGLVVMEIDAENSKLGPESDGVPVSISATGEVVRYPRIETTTAQTTISAMDGQTVVLGGLIVKGKQTTHRRVPYLADIPLLGDLFRYDLEIEQRSEMIIILTPRIVQTKEDAERIKQAEAARMSWCLADVMELHGDPSLRGRADEWGDSETRVIYPDLDPSGQMTPMPEEAFEGQEIIVPQGTPTPAEPHSSLPPSRIRLQPAMSPSSPPPADESARRRSLQRTPRPDMRGYPVEQVRHQWPADRGEVQRADYSGGGTVVPSTYQGPPQYQRPPYQREPAVQPTNYNQPQSASQPVYQPAAPSPPQPPPAYGPPVYQRPRYEMAPPIAPAYVSPPMAKSYTPDSTRYR